MPSFFFENIDKEIEKYNLDKKRPRGKQLAAEELQNLSVSLKNYCDSVLPLLAEYERDNPVTPKKENNTVLNVIEEENPIPPTMIQELSSRIKLIKEKVESGNTAYLFDVEEDMRIFKAGMEAMHGSAVPICNKIADLCALICVASVAVMLVQGVILPLTISTITFGFASQLFKYFADSVGISRSLEESLLSIARIESKLNLDTKLKQYPASEAPFHVSVNPQLHDLTFPKSFTPFIFPFHHQRGPVSQPEFNVSVSPKVHAPQDCPPFNVSVSPKVQAPQGYPPFNVSVSPKEQIPHATIEPQRSPRYFAANNNRSDDQSFTASVEPQQQPGYANHS